jgi:rhodanese-related sulfurtransferase
MSFDRLLAFAQLHPIAVAALVVLTVAIAFNEITRRLTGYKPLSPSQLTELVNREDALVIDVSPSTEFDKGHIAGARNVLPGQLEPDNKLIAKARDRPLVLVCRTGQASAQAAGKLVKAGYSRVHWLEGGLPSWQQAELPLVRGKG